ncbi:hypothetical protein [Frigoribacterium faeni]|uniref:Uncharacterized membrane protein YhaH (DUF805 family) n=1 Tax=Frigoribacterium faeni TaxID=145483 RepID=A0A7W3JK09_9MICO|nr:hypothetical protein [Frigoribacterium faeni]MBA8814238.1 uncharacterized membrane protein YhaH (DUF805 family) [Frigoribacterium faeni]BFF16305.1 hypothetical protein GCM10025699_76080 [Microbacterium flavescens]
MADGPADAVRPLPTTPSRVTDGPADAVLPLPPGRVRRIGYVLSPVVHALCAALAIVGAIVTTDAIGRVAATVATLLYVSSGLLSLVTTVMIVVVRSRVTRGGPRPPVVVPLVYALSPIAAALLLAAAYVSRLNGGPFVGGWAGMFVTTLSLVLLSRRLKLQGSGDQRQSSGGTLSS